MRISEIFQLGFGHDDHDKKRDHKKRDHKKRDHKKRDHKKHHGKDC
ncbi:MAG: hypothetical protein M3460_02735 [Actinomycetota bacterium]|nr:hypothetical protein [Actinomycetota bacterium]